MSDHRHDDLSGAMPDEPGAAYLWDRSEPVDPTVRALEELLARHRHREVPFVGSRRRPSRAIRLTAAAAAVLVLGIVAWYLWSGSGRATPPADGTLRIVDLDAPDRVFATGAMCAADLREVRLGIGESGVGEWGYVRLDPGTRIRFGEVGPAQVDLELLGGRIECKLDPAAVAHTLRVQTAIARCVTSGGSFVLSIGEKIGDLELQVGDGGAELQTQDSMAFVPAGARCSARYPERLGTPVFADADRTLAKLLAATDELSADDASRAEYASKASALVQRKRDTLSLWHLLKDGDPQVVAQAEAALERVAGVPPAALRQKQIRGIDPAIWRAFLEPNWR